MRKNLLLVALLCISAFSFAQTEETKLTCQELTETRGTQEWARVGDFTSDDINGNTHHLQEYLDDGKYVLVDLSATWCGPCWQLHQSGLLDELHEQYGPDGTDEMVVLWVEIEGSNTLAQIQGQHTGNTYAGASQGDFTDGGNWPIPIIDDRTIVSSFSALYEGYIPTLFLVCPNGDYTQVTTYSTSAIYNLTTQCPSATSVIDNNEVSVDIYPNPSNGMVQIEGAENAHITVFNNIGQVIYTKENISYTETIDLSKFEAGSYMIKVNLNGKVSNKHLVLTK